MKALMLIVLMALAACNEDASPKGFTFCNLSFELPSAWIQSGASSGNVTTWMPKDNARGESIVLIRAEAPADVIDDSSRLDEILGEAQGTITPDRVTAAAIRTSSGLVGSRVDLDFIPPTEKTAYHRVHVVLLDGQELIHVLYTARVNDSSLTALTTLLQTLRAA